MAEMNERGFEQYGDIETAYGHVIRVYESSAASGPHVWVSTVQTEETGARCGMEPEEATAHLNLVQAMRLRARLDEFIQGVPTRWTRGAAMYENALRELTPPEREHMPLLSPAKPKEEQR